MAQNAQRPLESKYARKKREEFEGTRPPFTFVPSLLGQANRPLQSEAAPPVTREAPPLQAARSGIVVSSKTWQIGRVKSRNDDDSGNGVMTVGGADYSFDFSKLRYISPEELAPGTEVFVKLGLNAQKDKQEVRALRLIAPADMPRDTWHESVLLSYLADRDMFADRPKYRGVLVPRAVVLRDLGHEVFKDGLKICAQVNERHAGGPMATAIRLRQD